MAKSNRKLTDSVRQMLAGLEANASEVVQRGATPEFTKSGKTLLASLEAMRAERDSMKAQRDSLKAALKTKNASLAVSMAQLKTWHSEARSVVKKAYRDQKEKLVEFGVKVKVRVKGKKKAAKKKP